MFFNISSLSLSGHSIKLPRLVLTSGFFGSWIVPGLLMLFSWQQSHFQFEEYWPSLFRNAIRGLMVLAVLAMFVFGLFRTCRKEIAHYVVLYALVTLFYGLLTLLVDQTETSLGYLKAAIVAVALLPILDDSEALKRFLRLNFCLGILLIALGTVPLLHYWGVINLTHVSIPRVGGGTGRPDLDPLSFGVFGIFGRVESYAQGGTNLPRLQGWSSEPLHWSYFVFWTLACWALTFRRSGSWVHFASYGLALILIIFHLWFLQSTVARIVGLVVICAIFCIWLTKKFIQGRSLSPWPFFLFLLTPCLLLPFVLSVIEPICDITRLFKQEQIFGEGPNWEGKIEFLKLGFMVMARWGPDLPLISVTHNLILDTYLRYGYLLLIPMLALFWCFMSTVTVVNSMMLNFCILIGVFVHALGVPSALFLPSGAMILTLSYAAVIHRRADISATLD